MNVIKDYIRNFLLLEQNQEEELSTEVSGEEDISNQMTYGDFINALNIITKEKGNLKTKENGKKYGKTAMKAALMLATGGWSEVLSTTMDAGEALKVLTQRDDDDSLKGFLGQFDLDDKTSMILDDKIEDKFIDYLKEKFKSKKDDIMPNEFDINKELNNFLKGEFERKVTK